MKRRVTKIGITILVWIAIIIFALPSYFGNEFSRKVLLVAAMIYHDHQ